MKSRKSAFTGALALLSLCLFSATGILANEAACRVSVDVAQEGKEFFEPRTVVRHEDTTLELSDKESLSTRVRITNHGPKADLKLIVDGVGIKPTPSADFSLNDGEKTELLLMVRVAGAECRQGETRALIRVLTRAGTPEQECGFVEKYFDCVGGNGSRGG